MKGEDILSVGPIQDGVVLRDLQMVGVEAGTMHWSLDVDAAASQVLLRHLAGPTAPSTKVLILRALRRPATDSVFVALVEAFVLASQRDDLDADLPAAIWDALVQVAPERHPQPPTPSPDEGGVHAPTSLTRAHIRNGSYWHDVYPRAVSLEDALTEWTRTASGDLLDPHRPLTPDLGDELVSDYKRRKIRQQWADHLPSMTRIKHFDAVSNQEMFDAVCALEGLESLSLLSSRVQKLDGLERLQSLRHLRLEGFTAVTDPEPLRALGGSLVTLEIENMKRVSDFSFVQDLPHLQGLAIEGSMWTTQPIDSLAPVAGLKNLQYLQLSNTRVADRSLDPLLDLTRLQRFDSAWQFTRTEFDKLKLVPSLEFGNSTELDEYSDYMPKEN